MTVGQIPLTHGRIEPSLQVQQTSDGLYMMSLVAQVHISWLMEGAVSVLKSRCNPGSCRLLAIAWVFIGAGALLGTL